jgi:hypothetical protein
MSKTITTNNIALLSKLAIKKPLRLSSKELAAQNAKIDCLNKDILAASEAWVVSGKKISPDLGDFFVKTVRRTTEGSPLIVLIVQRRLKIIRRYYAGDLSPNEIDYFRTIVDTIADAYAIPATYIVGYYLGFSNYFRNLAFFDTTSASAAILSQFKGYDLNVNKKLLFRGMKEGQTMRVAVRDVLVFDDD